MFDDEDTPPNHWIDIGTWPHQNPKSSTLPKFAQPEYIDWYFMAIAENHLNQIRFF